MRHARSDYQRIQDPEGLIPEDEPVFVIRGQDLAAPDTLDFYALKAEALGAKKDLIQKVREHAQEMRDWQTCYPAKVPDLPPEE